MSDSEGDNSIEEIQENPCGTQTHEVGLDIGKNGEKHNNPIHVEGTIFVDNIGDESFEDEDYAEESEEELIECPLTVSDVDDTSDEEVQDARRTQLYEEVQEECKRKGESRLMNHQKKKRCSDVQALGRKGIKMHCRACGGKGHNRRTCKNKMDSRDVSGSTSKDVFGSTSRDHLVGPSIEGGVATITSWHGSCTSNMGPATNKKSYKKCRNLGKKKVAELDGVRRGRGRPPKHVSKVQMKGYKGASSMETVHLEQRVSFVEMNQSLPPPPTTSTIPLPDQTDWINKL